MTKVEAAVLPKTKPNQIVREADLDIGELEESIARALNDPNCIVELDPVTIRPSSLPNREPSSFCDDSYFSLQANIAKERGNHTPIEVRRLKGVLSDGKEWEIVTGHRRWHACNEEGLLVRATIVQVDDKRLLIRRLAENNGRSDFSAFELGRICIALYKEGAYVHQKQLAVAITRDEGLVSKAMQLAALPHEILAAFESTRDLQFRYAKPLEDACKNRRERTLAVARDIAATGGNRKAADVLAALVSGEIAGQTILPEGTSGPQTDGIEPFKTDPPKHDFVVDGKNIGGLTIDEKGRVRVQIKMPLKPDVVNKLHLAMCRALGDDSKPVTKKNGSRCVKAESATTKGAASDDGVVSQIAAKNQDSDRGVEAEIATLKGTVSDDGAVSQIATEAQS